MVGKTKKEFEKLLQIVKKEIENGITKSDSQNRFNGIKQKITLLRENLHSGIQIPKKQIPKEYLKLNNVDNIWKVNLPNAWRIIYTIKGTEIEIISLVIDIFSHKKYERKFKYKKS